MDIKKGIDNEQNVRLIDEGGWEEDTQAVQVAAMAQKYIDYFEDLE